MGLGGYADWARIWYIQRFFRRDAVGRPVDEGKRVGVLHVLRREYDTASMSSFAVWSLTVRYRVSVEGIGSGTDPQRALWQSCQAAGFMRRATSSVNTAYVIPREVIPGTPVSRRYRSR